MDQVPENEAFRLSPSAPRQDTNYIGITINEHEDLSKFDIENSHNSLFDGQHLFEPYSNHPTGSLQMNNTITPIPSTTRPGQTSHHSPHSPNYTRPPIYTPQCAFRKVHSHADLKPSLRYPKSNILTSLTMDLTKTYQQCNSGFDYNTTHNPRRVLTKPNKPCGNDGYDNEEFDYILYVNDILGAPEGQRYLILDVLGAGTFGQVVKCKNLKTGEVTAVKVVKNKPAYFKQSTMEMKVLELLNQRCDPQDKHHILRLKDTFMHRKHLCLVFELLSVNLYELIKQNQFRGLSTNLIRVFTAQILDSLTVLNDAHVIHCDLKPENILLKNLDSPTIKVIDFGSACFEKQTTYTYIQSRFYRSPEVLLGLPYTSAIDMWSLGCIVAELFLGLPIFPGSSEYNQISRIVEMLGTPPTYMLDMGKNAERYFERYENEQGERQYKMVPLETYARKHGKAEQPSKKYFSAQTLPDLINSYPLTRKNDISQKEIEREKHNRLAFVDFLEGLLNLNHFERWSPQQAKQHPFITGEPFLGPFKPPSLPRRLPQAIKIPRSMPSLSVPDSSATVLSPQSSNNYLTPGAFSVSPSIGKPMTGSQTYFSPAANFSSQQKLAPLIEPDESGIHGKTDPRHTKRNSSYTALPLPRVVEPVHSMRYGDTSKVTKPIDTGFIPSTQYNPGVGVRPRANTIGTTQSPSRLTRTVLGPPIDEHETLPTLSDTTNALPDNKLHVRYPPQLANHQPIPTENDQGFAALQGVKVDSLRTSSEHPQYRVDPGIQSESPMYSSMLPFPVSSSHVSKDAWENQALPIDLERDGDWKEDIPRRSFHRRSNSSVRFSDIALPSSSAARSSVVNNVATLHRLVRGQWPHYNRQDIEWDGIHGVPTSTQDFEQNDFNQPSSWKTNRGNRAIHSWCEE